MTIMKQLLLILCFLPYTLLAQHDKAIEQIFLTGFGFYAPDPISGKVVGELKMLTYFLNMTKLKTIL